MRTQRVPHVSLEDAMSYPDTQLWCAVIYQAISDASTQRQSVQAQREKQEALDWLLKPNTNFDQVCALAGFDPAAVRERARKLFEPAPGVGQLFRETLNDQTSSTAQETNELEFS